MIARRAMRCDTATAERGFVICFFFASPSLLPPTDCCSECDVSRHQRRQVGLQSRISTSMDRFQVPSEKAIPSLASLLHFVFNVTPATTTTTTRPQCECWQASSNCCAVSISCCIIHCYALNTLRDVSGAAVVVYYCHMSSSGNLGELMGYTLANRWLLSCSLLIGA